MKNILITLTALMCSLSTAAFAGATNDLIYVRVRDAALNLRLSDTEAAKELKAMVDEKDVTVEMSDNVFEQYGSLGKNLTSDDVSIAAKAGDVLLYNSRYICIFYGQNTYRYTRLGRIENVGKNELKELLAGKDITITLTKKDPGEIPEPKTALALLFLTAILQTTRIIL